MATQFSIADKRSWKRPFFIIWGGQVFSLLGSRLVQFTLIWFLTVQTGSASVLATATLIGMLPELLLGPVIGTLIDRWNRRRIMLVADSVVALATLALAGLFAAGVAEIWHIYAAMLVRSLGGAFHHNSMAASTSLMVPREHLGRIQGLNQMLGGTLSIVAAPLGALLYEALPMQAILGIDVVTALIAIVPLLLINIPQPERARAAEGQPSIWGELKAGVVYVWSITGLMIMLVMASLLNLLFNPAGALMPLLVKDHFGKGALELGYLEAGFGIGIVLGGLLLGVWGGFRNKMVTVMVGLVGLGIGFGGLGLLPSPGFWAAVGFSVFAALMLPLVNGSLMAVIQGSVAPEMQGRVFTLLGTVSMAMSPLGLAIAGPVADALGIQFWYVMAGLLCVAFGLVGFFIPALMTMEAGAQEAAARHNENNGLLADVTPAE